MIAQSTKSGGWELISSPLVLLGLALLDQQGALGRGSRKLTALHNLGGRILVKVAKRAGPSCGAVLEPLVTRILTHRQAPQYTEALRMVVRDSATILMEQPGLLADLVEHLQTLSYFTARRVLTAIMPLVRLKRALRDSVILVLRKALFSRSVAARQTAVTGVLLLLRTFKISTSRAVSQLSQSSGSLSQLTLEAGRGGASSHDTLCSELLGVLRRCFTLRAEVKLTLYHGLSDVVAKNPELCESVLELLYSHTVSLVAAAEVQLDRCVAELEGDWQVVEPAGWFLHCTQLLVSRGQQLLGEESTEILERLLELLHNMAQFYSDTSAGELGFEDTDNYDKKTAEGERRSLKLDVLLTVMEALMEFLVTHGGESEEGKAGLLLKLQQRHGELARCRQEALARRQNKGKKGRKGEELKKGEEGGDKEKEKEAGNKRGRPASYSPSRFTMPGHCFSLKALSILVAGVLEDRQPRRQAALNILREDTGFLAWLMSVVAAKLQELAASLAVTGDEGPQHDIMFRHLVSLTASLFQHSVLREERVGPAVLPGVSSLAAALRILLPTFPR